MRGEVITGTEQAPATIKSRATQMSKVLLPAYLRPVKNIDTVAHFSLQLTHIFYSGLWLSKKQWSI